MNTSSEHWTSSTLCAFVRVYLTINNLNVSVISQNEGLLTREISEKKTRCCSFVPFHVLHVQYRFTSVGNRLSPPQGLRPESSNVADITAIASKCTDRPNCWEFRRNQTCDRHHPHHRTRKQHQNTCQTCGRNNSFTDTEGGGLSCRCA